VLLFDHLLLFKSSLLGFSNGDLPVVLLQTLLLFEDLEMGFSLFLGFGTFLTVLVESILFLLFEALELLNSSSHDFQVGSDLVDFFQWSAQFLNIQLSKFLKRLSETLEL